MGQGEYRNKPLGSHVFRDAPWVSEASRKEHLLGPAYVEHFQVVLDDPDLFLLVGLVEVLQDDGDVHVDYNHITDYNETGKVGDRQQRMTTVTVLLMVERGIAVWGLDHKRLQYIVPSGRRHESKGEVVTV